jgi:hypothetical protein
MGCRKSENSQGNIWEIIMAEIVLILTKTPIYNSKAQQNSMRISKKILKLQRNTDKKKALAKPGDEAH